MTFTSNHKRDGNAAIRMMVDDITLEDAAKYLNVDETYLEQSVLFARINDRLIVERKKGYIFVGDKSGGIHYPLDNKPQTLRDQASNDLMTVALERGTDDLDQIFIHWFRGWEKGKYKLTV